MLADIETALGDYTVFSNCCIVMRLTLPILAPEIPILNRECISSEQFLNTKVLNLGTSKVIFDMFITHSTPPTHITPLSPK